VNHGKSSIVLRYIKNTFNNHHVKTIKNIYNKIVAKGEILYDINIIDIGGENIYKKLIL